MGSRPNLPSDIASRLSNLPKRGASVGSVYAPLLTKSLDDFPYFRQEESGFNLIGVVDRAHGHDLADAVSKQVGERYCVPTIQVLFDGVYRDPEKIEDPLMKEVAEYTWAHAREAIVGRKVFSYPRVRHTDGEFRISGKSIEVDVDENDALAASESAGLLKLPKGAKIYRGRIWTDPASFMARWLSFEGCFRAHSYGPSYRHEGGVALLMRTDEMWSSAVVEVDEDDLEELKRKAKNYDALSEELRRLAQSHPAVQA